MDLGPKSAQERGSNFNMWVAPYFPFRMGLETIPGIMLEKLLGEAELP
jgi:hypothetical protein